MSLHGEYKVPGGKLVVADLELRDERLAAVEISGDFFLEPPEALTMIAGALEGLPADLGAEELADQIDAALPADVVLLGFTPLAVARAVRRALEAGAA